MKKVFDHLTRQLTVCIGRTEIIESRKTLHIAADKYRSTTTLNYNVTHNFQTEIQRGKIKQIPLRSESNTQSITELNYKISLQQK